MVAGGELEGLTSSDLVRLARRLGFECKPRLITDWVESGLLDKPQRRGAGRGRGSQPGRFPANQVSLFTELVKKRKTGAKIPALAQVPLYLWAYWGDDYVPLRQARRAFRTWLHATASQSKARSRENAAALLHQVADPDASVEEQRELRDLIVRIDSDGKVDNPTDFEDLLGRVVDPEGTGATIGPMAFGIGAREYVRGIVARAVILARVQGDKITDNDYQQARDLLRQRLAEYVTTVQPQLLSSLTKGQTHNFRVNVDDEYLLKEVGTNLMAALAEVVQPLRLPTP